MKLSRLFLFLCLLAQSPLLAQELTVLQVEISRGTSVVARPQLRVPAGRDGRVSLDGEWATNPLLKGLKERIEITPDVRGDDIALLFLIASGDRQLRPLLVIPRDVRGSVEWTAADGQPIRLSVSWVQ
jgi:hypothetical protein